MANKIRQIRIERGISQTRLARAAELSEPTLCAFEKGRVQPWPKARRSLAEALSIDEAVLFPDEPQRG